MQHGTVTGGGISLYELYAQAQDISQRQVSQPLAEKNGAFLANRDGTGIAAVKKLDFVTQTELEKIATDLKKDFLTVILEMAEAVYRGNLSLPLSTQNGQCLVDRNGETMMAMLDLNKSGREYTDKVMLETRAEIMRDIMSGEISLPLHMQTGENIAGRNNIMLAAVKAV